MGLRSSPKASRIGFKPSLPATCHICSTRMNPFPSFQTFEPSELSNHATEPGRRSNGGDLKRGTRGNG